MNSLSKRALTVLEKMRNPEGMPLRELIENDEGFALWSMPNVGMMTINELVNAGMICQQSGKSRRYKLVWDFENFGDLWVE